MSITKPKSDIVQKNGALLRVGSVDADNLDVVTDLVDDKLTKPFEISLSGDTITIAGSELQRLESDGVGGTQSADKIAKLPEKGLYTVVATSTLNVDTGVGAGDLIDTNPSLPVAVTAGEYYWIGFEKRSDDKVHIVYGASSHAVKATAPYPVFGSGAGFTNIAMLALLDDGAGSSTTNWNFLAPVIADLIIFQASGGGGGDGDANADFLRYVDRLDGSTFEYVTPNIARLDEDSKIDGGSTTGYDIVSQNFKFLANSEAFISTQMLDPTFLADGLDVSRVELMTIWDQVEIDTGATYELSLDGGTNYETISDMDRIGNSDLIRGTHTFVGSKASGTITITDNAFDGTAEVTDLTTFGSLKEINTFRLDEKADFGTSTFFTIYDALDVEQIQIWFDKTGADGAPAIGTHDRAVQVNISTAVTKGDVAALFQTAMNGDADFTAVHNYDVLSAAIAYDADDGTPHDDETAAANEGVTSNDMTLLPAAPAIGDAYYFAYGAEFSELDLEISTQGAGTWTITWEYWNAAWVALAGVVDGTTGFTATVGLKNVAWTVPGDWATTSVNAQGPFYYVRARVSAFTSITTQPLGEQAFIQGETVTVTNAANGNSIDAVDVDVFATAGNFLITKDQDGYDVTTQLNGKTFTLKEIVAGVEKTVGVWIDVDDSGTTIPADAADKDRAIEITTITNAMTADQIATELQTRLDIDTAFTVTVAANVITINNIVKGDITGHADGGTNPTGFTPFTVTTTGNNYDIVTVDGVNIEESVDWFKGADTTASARLLAQAINLLAGTNVFATYATNVVNVEAREAGPEGNLITLAETEATQGIITDNFNIPNATLLGGHTLPEVLSDLTEDGVKELQAGTNFRRIGQQFTIASTMVVDRTSAYLNKLGTPSGTYRVRIVKDDTGAPSTDPTDIIMETNNKNIADLATGDNEVIFNEHYILPAGDYHLVYLTDETYKSSYVASTHAARVRMDATTGTAPLLRYWDGTVWSAGETGENAIYKFQGKILDLRVKITSNDTTGLNKELRSYGIFYKNEPGVVDLGGTFIQRFQFSGDDNVTQFSLNWQPSSEVLFCITDTGDFYTYGLHFSMQGQTVVFDDGTFQVPGETIDLKFIQLTGASGDQANLNTLLVQENAMGSMDDSIDRGVAGLGPIVRRKGDGKRVQIFVDENSLLGTRDLE